MSSTVLRGLALALVAFSVAGPAGSAEPAKAAPAAPAAKPRRDPNLILADPLVRRGVLANGLRYAVMQNATPKGVVSIRLGMDVGSFEEHDDERGVAHFVEHMAFEGSRSFPAGRIDQVFAAKGVGFGRDQNAFTTINATSYHLDLPNADAAGLDLGFRWIRDVADGVGFAPDAVQREKGIVLAEKEARSDANDQAQEEVRRFQAPGLRSVLRDPIGTVESIQAMTPERLRAFYDRWYRPDNAVVVVVGDQPVEALEQRVKASFASWTARGPEPARAPVVPIDSRRKADSLTVSDPHFPTVASVCRLRAPDPRGPDDVVRRRRGVEMRLWRSILEARLARAQNRAQPPYLAASIVNSNDSRDVMGTCLVVAAIKDGWQIALQTAQAEVRRFAAEGPTDAEFEGAVEKIRSGYRGEAARASTRQSDELATQLLGDALEGDVSASPREDFRAFDVAVEGMTPQDVRAAFARDWTGAGPLLVLFAPQPEDKAALLAAWTKGETAAGLEKYADAKATSWAYPAAVQPGRVTRREPVAEGDFVRLTFRNGVVVNFKHVEFVRHEAQVKVRFGLGRREIPRNDYFAASMASGLFEAGGLGRHGYTDIEAMFHNGGWGAKMAVLDDAFTLSGTTSSGSLDSELQILAAYLTDPGFNARVDALLPTAMDLVYRTYRTSPGFVLSQALNDAIAPGSPVSLPSREALGRMKSAQFQALLKPAVTTAPIEVTIVGDVDEKTVTEAVASTLGALPPRKPRPPARPDTWFMRFPEHAPPPIRVTHEGSADKALVGVVWPLYVATPERRREEVAIFLLAKVMSNEMLHRIRQELGKTYAPEATTATPDKADQGYLMASVEAYPADIDQVTVEIRKTAERLVRGEITADALEEARKPILAGVIASHETAGFWAGMLDGSARDPERVRDTLGLPALFAGVTLEEVRKAAADWLSKEPIVVVATPAPGAAATVPAAGKPNR